VASLLLVKLRLFEAKYGRHPAATALSRRFPEHWKDWRKASPEELAALKATVDAYGLNR